MVTIRIIQICGILLHVQYSDFRHPNFGPKQTIQNLNILYMFSIQIPTGSKESLIQQAVDHSTDRFDHSDHFYGLRKLLSNRPYGSFKDPRKSYSADCPKFRSFRSISNFKQSLIQQTFTDIFQTIQFTPFFIWYSGHFGSKESLIQQTIQS